MTSPGAVLVVRDVAVRAVAVVSGHLLRVTPTRQWLEWQDWAHPVLARPFEVRSGKLHLPDVPGNGLEWDEGAVARYQSDN